MYINKNKTRVLDKKELQKMINSIKGKKRKNKRFKIVNNEQDGRFKSKLINCYIK